MKSVLLLTALLFASLFAHADESQCLHFGFAAQMQCTMDSSHPDSCAWFNAGVYLRCHPNPADCCYDDQGNLWMERCAQANASDTDCAAVAKGTP